MKLSKLITIILLTILGISACKPSVSPENEKLYAEVMRVHDDIMPEMGTIHKLRKKLKAETKKESTSSDQRDQYLLLIEALDEADDDMMLWMKGFKLPEGENFETQKKYLLQEQIKIQKVDQSMRNAIKNAKKILDEIK